MPTTKPVMAGDGTDDRQSTLNTSSTDLDRRFSPVKESFGRSYTSVSAPNMATVVMNPVSAFPPHPPPPYSHHSTTLPSVLPLSGLISPPPSNTTDSRRSGDESKDSPPSSHRQSLPSIHEALGDRDSSYTTYPSTPMHGAPYTPTYPPSSMTPTSRPFSTTAPAPHPSYTHSAQRNSPPQSFAPPRSVPRNGVAPYSDPYHPSTQTRMAHPPQAQPNGMSREGMGRYEQEPRYHDRDTPLPAAYGRDRDQYRGYPSRPGTNAHAPGPPPIQSRFHVDPENVAETIKKGESVYSHPPFSSTLKRSLEDWEVESVLQSIMDSSLLVHRGAADARQDAQRRLRTGMMENIPSIPMCDQWLAENDKIRANLLSMKARIAEQESMLAEQQSRQAGRGHMDYDKDDMDAWGNDRDHLNGGMSGPKRHRRAAPPGRCHSCNRAETPEWRRGPDGARTLCNACGLHYAKLTRKTISKQGQGASASIRPKSMDES